MATGLISIKMFRSPREDRATRNISRYLIGFGRFNVPSNYRIQYLSLTGMYFLVHRSYHNDNVDLGPSPSKSFADVGRSVPRDGQNLISEFASRRKAGVLSDLNRVLVTLNYPVLVS
jgi:hypothetical protein